jgi:hypothetical protein
MGHAMEALLLITALLGVGVMTIAGYFLARGA